MEDPESVTIKEEPLEDNVVTFVKGYLNILPSTTKKSKGTSIKHQKLKKEEKVSEMKIEPSSADAEEQNGSDRKSPNCIIQMKEMEVFSCHECDFVSVDWKNLMMHNEHMHLSNDLAMDDNEDSDHDDEDEDIAESPEPDPVRSPVKTVNLLSCKHCNFVTADYQSFKSHLEKNHNGTVSKKKYVKKKKPSVIGAGNHSIVFHKCHLCVKSYDNEASLKEHIKLYHNEDFSCEFCGSKYSQRKSLKEHQRLYCKALKCQICTKIFKDLISLEDHTNSAHTDPAEVECDICHKIFSNLVDMKNHQPTCQHQSQCRECYRKFTSSDELEEHARTCQLNEKPYRCIYCEKSFLKKSDFHSHMGHKHNGEPHFECGECNLKFLTKGKLKRHKLVFHLKEKVFQCEMCPKSFYTNNLKKRHFQVIHQRLLAMKCRICGNELINATAMKKHLEKLHNITS